MRTKWRKESSEQQTKNPKDNCDLISDLPEPLLLHILSFMTMEDVIRTSLLSKRWRELWKSVPSMNFKSPSVRSRGKLLPSFIDTSLALYEGSKIHKFSISSEYSNGSKASQVNSWIHFAIKNNVEELFLDIVCADLSNKSCKLPHSILNCQSLKALEMSFRDLDLPASMHLSSLKTLSLGQIHLADDAINNLASSCPLLEELCLTSCNKKCDLNIFITNVNIKILKIHDYNEGNSNKLVIYAPYLLSLELLISMGRRRYDIKQLQSLVTASFDCRPPHGYCHRLCKVDNGYQFAKILDDLNHVRDLKLGGCFIQVLSMRGLQGLDPPSIYSTRIGLKTGLMKWELLGLSYLLRGSPNIETLIIFIDKTKKKELNNDLKNKYDFEEAEFWNLQEPGFSHLLQNLRTVKIYGLIDNFILLQRKHRSSTIEELFKQRQNDLNLLRFLLKNSKALEKMIIGKGKNVHLGKCRCKKLNLLFELSQKLLSFLRASPNAKISFS